MQIFNRVILELPGLAFPIKVTQHCLRHSYGVVYGQQVRSNLTRGQAAAELGECIFHALECAGKLDGDT